MPGPPFSSTPTFSPGLPDAVPSGGAQTPSGFTFPDPPPKLTINGMQRNSQQTSPGYPVSPDPFAHRPSFGTAGEAILSGASSVSPPTRNESLPGSRFSQDSMKQGAASTKDSARERTNSTAGVVKGFKRLWRKSSASGMAALSGNGKGQMPAPPLPAIPMSPHPTTAGIGGSMAAQQASFMSAQQPSRASFSSQPSTQQPQSPSPSMSSDATGPKRGSDIDPFIFDQESTRYPTIVSPSVSSTSTTPAPSINDSVGKKAGSGIVKSWGNGTRGRSPSVSTTNSVPGVSTSTVPLPTDQGRASNDYERPKVMTRARTPTTGKRASGQTLANFLSEDPTTPSGPAPRPVPKGGNYI